MKIRGSTVFDLLLVAIAILFAVSATGYRGMAGFVPLVLAIPTGLLAAMVLLSPRFPAVIRYFEGGLEDLLHKSPAEEQNPGASRARPDELRLILQSFGWFVGFTVLLFFAGFYVAVGVFALAFMRFQGRIGWMGAIVVTIVAEAFFFFIFEQTLNVSLFRGIFFGASLLPL